MWFLIGLSETEIKLLLWRSGKQCTGTDDIVPIIDTTNICNHHHHALYLEQFSEHVKKTCFDPLKVNKKSKKQIQGRRIISLKLATMLKASGIRVTNCVADA